MKKKEGKKGKFFLFEVREAERSRKISPTCPPSLCLPLSLSTSPSPSPYLPLLSPLSFSILTHLGPVDGSSSRVTWSMELKGAWRSRKERVREKARGEKTSASRSGSEGFFPSKSSFPPSLSLPPSLCPNEVASLFTKLTKVEDPLGLREQAVGVVVQREREDAPDGPAELAAAGRAGRALRPREHRGQLAQGRAQESLLPAGDRGSGGDDGGRAAGGGGPGDSRGGVRDGCFFCFRFSFFFLEVLFLSGGQDETFEFSSPPFCFSASLAARTRDALTSLRESAGPRKRNRSGRG